MFDKATLNALLKFGVELGASDIHFEAGSPPCYRVKGELHRAKYNTLDSAATMAIAQSILAEQKLDVSHNFREIDASYSIAGVSRFRASIFRQRGSIGCVLRVIPFQIRPFDELNLPEVLQRISELRRGLVLVTGATGMGKSTTIAAMLNHINLNRAAHIITIEDPIEFLFENKRSLIIQREVGSDTGSYRDAMLSSLRQDPDIVMLGEVRDDQTAMTCLKAAETGHLVITALHTPDATSTIKRFMGFFDPRESESQLSRFADALQAVICQRLVPRSDSSGVIPALEIMRVTHILQECIRDRARHGEIAQHMAEGKDLYGMQTFDQHLIELVRQGKTTIEIAKFNATSPAEVERALLLE
ncbi:MAG: PilT/PilU family type 4a pilus ATPase [Candidatus Schekmanbacteria bacterium]|nr:PilT/PilU family type 4a pilus ATPase [Candidatus Schekmanbacteria bacterium]